MNYNENEAWVIDSIERTIPPAPSSTARIPRVPNILRETSGSWQYIPKVVSIGPYHNGNPRLESVEKLKPIFTKELLSRSQLNVNLSSLYKKLGEANIVQELREFYEENSTDHLSDKEFTRMMLLDGCFIVYYILYIYGAMRAGSYRQLRSQQIALIHQDLFLLENQIPFKVLNEVMTLTIGYYIWPNKMRWFLEGNILARGKRKRVGYVGFGNRDQNYGRHSKFEADHLLHLLHYSLTTHLEESDWFLVTHRFGKSTSTEPNSTTPTFYTKPDKISNMYSFRNVSELTEVGVHFKPSTSVMSLAHVEFVRWLWYFSADLKLPPIIVDDSTKPMWLNLIAYEICSDDTNAWVTSYICLLDSLIDQPEDVKALRKAGVIDNSFGSDKEIATLFNAIGTDLFPNKLAYSEVKKQIESHYESVRKTRFSGLRKLRLSQLKQEYIKSPWSFLAFIGAVLALFLTAVQTYFAVWSPKGECDNLCTFLNKNHRL